MKKIKLIIITLSVFLAVSLGLHFQNAWINYREKTAERIKQAKQEGIIEGVKNIKQEMYNNLRMYGEMAVDFPLPLEEGEEEPKVLRVFLIPKVLEE
ncbi:hypothetical protein KAU11_07140 [Candidatus Babeliales bacterium]|nr:hypothetical protein [Candidatus Babeliales bacterium]